MRPSYRGPTGMVSVARHPELRRFAPPRSTIPSSSDAGTLMDIDVFGKFIIILCLINN